MANAHEPILLGRRRTPLYTIVSVLYALIAKLVFRMRFEGLEHIPTEGPVLLMANHQSFWDPCTLVRCGRGREIHFMGKKELFAIPVLGALFRAAHGFPVDRGGTDMQAMRTGLAILAGGDILGIFPEGTRAKTAHMLPLHGGASMIAMRSRCPVVPVYIEGRYRPFARMTVRVGAPIEADDLYAGRVNRASCDELTARIEARFAQLSGGKSLPPAKDA